jgi:hypothetical protein
MWIADWHADSLLWPNRDLLRRLSYGHVDVPRLIHGNVALQAFTIVTGTPPKMNFNGNAAPTTVQDSITIKAFAEVRT